MTNKSVMEPVAQLKRWCKINSPDFGDCRTAVIEEIEALLLTESETTDIRSEAFNITEGWIGKQITTQDLLDAHKLLLSAAPPIAEGKEPVEPTEEMIKAACQHMASNFAMNKGYGLDDHLSHINFQWERYRHEVTELLNAAFAACPTYSKGVDK